MLPTSSAKSWSSKEMRRISRYPYQDPWYSAGGLRRPNAGNPSYRDGEYHTIVLAPDEIIEVPIGKFRNDDSELLRLSASFGAKTTRQARGWQGTLKRVSLNIWLTAKEWEKQPAKPKAATP